MIDKITFDRYKREFYIDDMYSILMQIFNENQLNSGNQYNIKQLEYDPNTELKNDIKRYTAKLDHTKFMIDKCIEEEKYELASELKRLKEELEVLISNLKQNKNE
jgi:hypothetical protein